MYFHNHFPAVCRVAPVVIVVAEQRPTVGRSGVWNRPRRGSTSHSTSRSHVPPFKSQRTLVFLVVCFYSFFYCLGHVVKTVLEKHEPKLSSDNNPLLSSQASIPFDTRINSTPPFMTSVSSSVTLIEFIYIYLKNHGFQHPKKSRHFHIMPLFSGW